MYQLNKKAMKGLVIAGSLLIAAPFISRNQTEQVNQKKKLEVKQEANKEIFGPYLNQEISTSDLNGCIVYKKYISRKINGEWTDWEEDPMFYIGTRSELEEDEYQENDTLKVKKETIGFIENDYTEEDFVAIKRTYHEEFYEDEFIDDKWHGEWKTVGEPLVLMNSKTLPERCLSRWVLDNVQLEKVEPIVSETELYQKYELVIKDGDFTYEPTCIYTTIENLPDSDYKFVSVGEYQKTEELEKEMAQGNTLYKTL